MPEALAPPISTSFGHLSVAGRDADDASSIASAMARPVAKPSSAISAGGLSCGEEIRRQQVAVEVIPSDTATPSAPSGLACARSARLDQVRHAQRGGAPPESWSRFRRTSRQALGRRSSLPLSQ